MVGALLLVPGATDGLQRDRVVSAAGDAPHHAFCFHSVTLRMAAWGRQRSDVRLGAVSWRPGHVCHGLGHLAHRETVWTTRC